MLDFSSKGRVASKDIHLDVLEQVGDFHIFHQRIHPFAMPALANT